MAAAILTVATVVTPGLLFCHARWDTITSSRYGSGGGSSGGWGEGEEGDGAVGLSFPSYVENEEEEKKSKTTISSVPPQEESNRHHGNLRTQLPAAILGAPDASEDATAEKEEHGFNDDKTLLRSFLGLFSGAAGFFSGDTPGGIHPAADKQAG